MAASCIDGLPNELLVLICETYAGLDFNSTSIDQLKNISLVSKSFRDAALPTLLRNSTLVTKGVSRMKDLAADPAKGLLRFVAKLYVEDTSCTLYTALGSQRAHALSDIESNAFLSVLTSCTHLKDLTIELSNMNHFVEHELRELASFLRVSDLLDTELGLPRLRRFSVVVQQDKVPSDLIVFLVNAFRALEHLSIASRGGGHVAIDDWTHAIQIKSLKTLELQCKAVGPLNSQANSLLSIFSPSSLESVDRLILQNPRQLKSGARRIRILPNVHTVEFTANADKIIFEEDVFAVLIPTCLPSLQELDITYWDRESGPSILTILEMTSPSLQTLSMDVWAHELFILGSVTIGRWAHTFSNKDFKKLILQTYDDNLDDAEPEDYYCSQRALRNALAQNGIQLEIERA